MAIIQTPKRYAFVLDTTITNHIPRMTFSQSDVGSNILTISLTQNLVPYPLTTTGLIINLFVINGSSKSWQSSTDGSIVITSTTGGTVEITMSSGTISNIGTNSCEINVQDILGNDYTFPPFKFEVIASYANDVVSTNDLLPLIQATTNVNTAYTSAVNYTKMEIYDPTHAYVPLNKVLYQGGVYQNIIASIGISPTYNADNANWLCISPKSSDGYASIIPSSFTATANNTTHIITGYTTYDKTHDTMQVIDATYGDVLIKNIDYTENADNLSIDLINNNILNTSEVMVFNLYKNINDSTIQSDIASAITAKNNLDASISTGNSTKSAIDASIANGQLGNASTLTTTSKVIVGAINENKANIDLKASIANMGIITNLPTTDKSSVVNAIIEIVSSMANNTGEVAFLARNTAPTGYLKANGATVSRTAYARLFTAIGTTFGIGDGSTTFGLPDLRGYFIRGWDDSRGIDTGRTFGSIQTDDFKSHTHTQALGGALSTCALAAGLGVIGQSNTSLVSTTGGTETRPKNIALLAVIKY